MTLLQTPPGTSLPGKIKTLAAAIRRRLMLLGLMQTLAGAVSAALILGAADYFLHFPGMLRLVLIVLFMIGTFAAVIWKVIRPALRRVPRAVLAHHLEKTGHLDHDEISAALDFLDSGLHERNALAAQSVETARTAAAHIRLGDALSWKFIRRYAGWFAVAVAVCAGLALTAPRLASISLRRWTNPLAATPWPLHVLVSLNWGKGGPPKILPSGDPFAVTARVERGFNTQLRVWLEIRRPLGGRQAELMTWQGRATGSVYQKVILPQPGRLMIRVRAGDDDRNPWVSVLVLPRPRILSMTGTIAPPAYAKGAPHYQINLLTHRAEIIRGSTLDIAATSNQGIYAAHVVGGPPPVRVVVPGTHSGPASKRAEIIYQPQTSFTGRLEVADSHHLKSYRGGRFRVVVVPDALPQVAITHPRYALDLTPQALIHLHIRASDDLGLTTLAIVGVKRGAGNKAKPTFTQSARWRSLRYSALTHGEIGKAVVPWTPESMHLKPGDQIDLMAQVRDNYVSRKAPYHHPAVDSPRLVISILTPGQIERQLQRSLQGVRRSIESLIRRQRVTRDQAQLLQQAISSAHALTAAQKLLLSQLPRAQNREALSAEAITRELKLLSSTARRNGLLSRSIGRTITGAQHVMSRVGGHVMPRAQSHLSHANRSVTAGQVQQAGKPLGAATQRESQAIRRMKALVAQLGAAGIFNSLRHSTARLLAQQEHLEKQLRKLAKRTLGRPFSELSKALQQQVQRLGAEQQQLAAKAARLTNNLNRAARQLAKSNPHMAAALKAAAQLAARYSVVGAMGQAASNAAQNHLQSASSNQKQAASGLKKMLHMLNQQAKRSLSRQINRLKTLLQQVQALLRNQKLLATTTASEPLNASRVMLAPVANHQSTLELTAAELAGKSRRADPSGYAHAYLMAASHQMGRATGQLENANQPLAVPHQVQAISWLTKAVAILQKLLNQDRAKKQMQTLSGLKALYMKIRQQQHRMYKQSEQLATEIHPGRPPERMQILQIAGQAKGETQLMHQLAAITAKIGKAAPVLAWMNRGIGKSMHAARRRLDQAQIDSVLLADQQMAISQLDAVIQALANHMKHMSGGGGGGGGGGGKQPLIPPAAQLKLLRILQMQINLQTQQLDTTLGKTSTGAARQALQEEIRMLGHQQNRIHRQAVKMIKSMQKAGG
jgi:hypothetical protein